MPRKPATKSRISEPPETVLCPFSGEPLRIVQNERSGYWQTYGNFWFSKPFQTKRQLIWALCHRNGEEPGFPQHEVQSIRTIELPASSAVADQVEQAKVVQEKVDEYIEVNAKALGLKK